MVKEEIKFNDGTRIFYEEERGRMQRFIEYSYTPQELEKINPSLVSDIEFQGDTQKIINNSKLIFYSLKGVQELEEKVNNQQKEIDELRKMVEELKKGEK